MELLRAPSGFRGVRLQSLNVNQRRYLAAAVTSFLLGIGGFFLTSVIGEAKGQEGTVLWWAFVLAGPAGIVLAIAVHPLLVRAFGPPKG